MSWFSISSLVTQSALQKPSTRLYPFEKRPPYPKTRGHIEMQISTCTFCNICAHKCPTRAIVVNKKDKVWAIDHTRCILCGNCVDECRRSCLSQSTSPEPPMRRKQVQTLRQEFSPPDPVPAGEAKPAASGADGASCCSTGP